MLKELHTYLSSLIEETANNNVSTELNLGRKHIRTTFWRRFEVASEAEEHWYSEQSRYQSPPMAPQARKSILEASKMVYETVEEMLRELERQEDYRRLTCKGLTYETYVMVEQLRGLRGKCERLFEQTGDLVSA